MRLEPAAQLEKSDVRLAVILEFRRHRASIGINPDSVPGLGFPGWEKVAEVHRYIKITELSIRRLDSYYDTPLWHQTFSWQTLIYLLLL